MGVPDMRVPIRFAMTYPERSKSNIRHFDIKSFSKLTFECPDTVRFPAISLGFKAVRNGGLTGAVLNAANEVAVDLFLKHKISFDEITSSVVKIIDKLNNIEKPSLEEVLSADKWAREELIRCS